MHAIRQYEFGPPHVLQYGFVEDPQPRGGEVRIKAGACGVHLIDTVIRSGAPGPFAVRLPMIPGREVAGVVDALGDGVDPGWLGARVVAHLGPASGGYAELAVRDCSAIHAIPPELSDDAAVAMVGTGRTTLSILDIATPIDGEVMIVTAAAGGIGSLLVQAGAAAGATVIALAGSPGKLAIAQELGAQVAIDYRDPEWVAQLAAARLGKPTLAYDGVGGVVRQLIRELLGAHGHHVIYGSADGGPGSVAPPGGDRDAPAEDAGPGPRTSYAVGPTATAPKRSQHQLEQAALAAAAGGTLTPVVNPAFALAQAGDAHAALEARETTGKVVLHP
jgi:NADPH2:quinone reductase